VQAGQPLLQVHAASAQAAQTALAQAQAALQVADAAPQLGPLLQFL
jgi:thymidine phosphorylase